MLYYIGRGDRAKIMEQSIMNIFLATVPPLLGALVLAFAKLFNNVTVLSTKIEILNNDVKNLQQTVSNDHIRAIVSQEISKHIDNAYNEFLGNMEHYQKNNGKVK